VKITLWDELSSLCGLYFRLWEIPCDSTHTSIQSSPLYHTLTSLCTFTKLLISRVSLLYHPALWLSHRSTTHLLIYSGYHSSIESMFFLADLPICMCAPSSLIYLITSIRSLPLDFLVILYPIASFHEYYYLQLCFSFPISIIFPAL